MTKTLTPPSSGFGRLAKSGSCVSILSISSVFPNPDEPWHGLFVRSRLQALSDNSEVAVLVPVPVIDYARGFRGFRGPFKAAQDSLEVRYLRWLYPPLGSVINACLLFLRLLWPVIRISKARRVEVLDAHFGYPEGVAAAMLSVVTGLPLVVTLRGNEPMHAKYAARRWLMKWMLRRASLVITLSGRLRDFAVSFGVPTGRVAVIPNGIDEEIFHPRERRRIRRELGLSPEARIILSVGSLIERKGHHRIITAAADLRKQGVPVTVLIAGGRGREGDFHDILKRQAARYESAELVRFMGLLCPTELANLMSAADVFCLASTREGWPNVVHEALACGTPVVATDVGAVPEMLPDDRFGIVVPPNDQDALSLALRQALERDWDRGEISQFGQSRGWKQVAREVLSGMYTVLHKNGDAWAADNVQR